MKEDQIDEDENNNNVKPGPVKRKLASKMKP